MSMNFYSAEEIIKPQIANYKDIEELLVQGNLSRFSNFEEDSYDNSHYIDTYHHKSAKYKVTNPNFLIDNDTGKPYVYDKNALLLYTVEQLLLQGLKL